MFLFNINLTDENFDYGDPATINHLGLWIGMPNLNNGKPLKKEVLMPVTWNLAKWWDWCLSEDEKKEYIQFLLIMLESDKKVKEGDEKW